MQKTPRVTAITRISIAIVVTSALAVSAFAVASVGSGGSGPSLGSSGSGEAAASAAELEHVAISVAANLRNVPTRDGDFDDLSRYCDPNDMSVTWERPVGTFSHGAHIEPLGPEPGPDTTSVNGVVVCDGSTYTYMGFEALRDADGWQVIPIPDIGGGEEEDTSKPEAPGDAVIPTLVPRATPPKATAAAPPAGKLPSAAKALTAAIESYSGYDSQSTCSPSAKPGVRAFRALLLKTYSNTRSLGITRSCSVGGKSEHKEGRAFDWGVNVNRASERATAERVIDWLFATDSFGNTHAMARRLGIMYIVWNRKIWGAYRSGEGWRTYSGANPHTDHVHFSFAWPGANGVTSFWTGVPAAMPGGTSGRGEHGRLVNGRTGGARDRIRGDRLETPDWRARGGRGGDSVEYRRHRGYWTYDREDGWTWHQGPRPSPSPSATRPSTGWGESTISPTPRPSQSRGSGDRRGRGDGDRDRYRREREQYWRERRGTASPSPWRSPSPAPSGTTPAHSPPASPTPTPTG